MSLLRKSTPVVLIEGAAKMKRLGGPDYIVDRLAILAAVALENRTDAHRLISSIYAGAAEESALFGDNQPEAST